MIVTARSVPIRDGFQMVLIHPERLHPMQAFGLADQGFGFNLNRVPMRQSTPRWRVSADTVVSLG